ncbi:MAG: hypothetical protein LBT67_01585 [Holosporaceae bacterium]|jgi:hypothetical protein|nr:hypothetical protein [Holosporaceae bacterium]
MCSLTTRKKDLFLAISALFVGCWVCRADEPRENTSAEVAPVESRSKVSHEEAGPSITRKVVLPEGQSQTKSTKNNKKDITMICYRNGVCLVKDRRRIKTVSGVNKITFDNLYAGLDRESINFRTPKKGKIVVRSFSVDGNEPSRLEIFSNAVGKEVFYQRSDSGSMEKGTLLGIFLENNEHHAIIKVDDKHFVLSLKKCIAVGEKSQKSSGQNSLDLTFDVTEADDLEIEISYLTKNIYWKHTCLVDVFEKMDRIDIISQALVENKSGYDIDDAEIIFAAASPSFGGNCENNGGDRSLLRYKRNLSIKNNADSTCILKTTKEIKPRQEYAITVPFNAIYGSTTATTAKELNLVVKNLLIVENATAAGLDANFDGDVLLFYRMHGERNFLGKQNLSSIRRGADLAFEIGDSNGEVIGSARLTDARKISEKDQENWISVVLKNCKSTAITVSVEVDFSGQWRVSKENFEMQNSDKPLWRLHLEPNETKELHFRMVTYSLPKTAA